MNNVKAILFLGDSLTAGYGISPSSAYPELVQRKIQKENFPYRVINAGVSGDTTAGGLARLSTLLKTKPDVFVLELGINDCFHGIPTADIERNLQSIIRDVIERNPLAQLVVVGMKAPPELGAYADEFESIFPRIARRNNAALVPFLLEGVARIPELNLPDGIHPTEKGQTLIAENVWKVLRPVLQGNS